MPPWVGSDFTNSMDLGGVPAEDVGNEIEDAAVVQHAQRVAHQPQLFVKSLLVCKVAVSL